MQTKESITIADVIHQLASSRHIFETRGNSFSESDLRREVSNAYGLALEYLNILRQRVESLRVPYNPREGLVAQYIRGINTTCNKILSGEPIVSKKLP